MNAGNSARIPRRPNILVVEDDADTRELWELVLSDAGFQVRTAESVADGFNSLRGDEPIDVIVCDYWLPDGTGEELLREATRCRLLDPGRALLCTAHQSVDESSYAPVVHKPVVPENLVARVRELLPREAAPVA